VKGQFGGIVKADMQLEPIQIDSHALLGGFLHSEILPAVKLPSNRAADE
jgi:hypothetical protein